MWLLINWMVKSKRLYNLAYSICSSESKQPGSRPLGKNILSHKVATRANRNRSTNEHRNKCNTSFSWHFCWAIHFWNYFVYSRSISKSRKRKYHFYYIIGTHSNNVLIWFTKRILCTVFCGHFLCVPNDYITHIFSKTTTPIDPVFCHHTAYSRPTKLCF